MTLHADSFETQSHRHRKPWTSPQTSDTLVDSYQTTAASLGQLAGLAANKLCLTTIAKWNHSFPSRTGT